MDRYSEEELKLKYNKWKKLEVNQSRFLSIGMLIFLLSMLIDGIYIRIKETNSSENIIFDFLPLLIALPFSISLIVLGLVYLYKKKKVTEEINLNFKADDIVKNKKDGWTIKYKQKMRKLKINLLLLTILFITIMVISIIIFSLEIINIKNDELSILGTVFMFTMIVFFLATIFPVSCLFYSKIRIYNIDGYNVLYYFGFSNLIVVEGEIQNKSFISSPTSILLPNNYLIAFIPDKYISSALIIRHQHLEYIGMNSLDFSLPDIKTK